MGNEAVPGLNVGELPIVPVSLPVSLANGPTSGPAPIGPGPVSVAGPGTSAPVDTPPVVGPAVPEPASWLMMLAGFGLTGAGLRASGKRARGASKERRRSSRYRKVAGAASVLEGVATPISASVQTGAQTLKAGLMAKAAMCVCPPVVMAMTAMAVPPARHAIYNATGAPAVSRPTAPFIPQSAGPCIPGAASSTLVADLLKRDTPATDWSRVASLMASSTMASITSVSLLADAAPIGGPVASM